MSWAVSTGPLAGASWVREASSREPAGAPAFVPGALLEYDLPPGTGAELALVVETELLRLGACEARLELDLGRVLGAVTLRVARDLGYSSLTSLASERLGFSWSHGRELVAIATALAELPVLRAAFLGGALERCKLREVVRVATPETETGWLVLARRLGTRALVRAVAAEAERRRRRGASETRPDVAERADIERVKVRARAADALFIEHVGRPMLQAVVGTQGPDHALFEAVAADALADFGPEAPEPATAQPTRRCVQRRRRRASVWADDVGARRVLHRYAVRLGGIPAVAWPDVRVLPESPAELLDLCERLVRWRRGLAWQRGRLLDLFLVRGWYRHREHRHFAEWHERRLGLSPREVRGLIAVSREAERLPALSRAWRRGDIDPAQVRLIAPLATPMTDTDWASFARQATRKRLEVEVAAHRALRAGLGERRWFEITSGRPMREATMVSLLRRWDRVIERALRSRNAGASSSPGVRATKREPFKADGTLDDRHALRQELLDGPLLGQRRVTLAFDAPPEVASIVRQALRQTARATGWTLDEGGCLRVMVERFAATHVVEGLEDRAQRARILRRDGYECAMPHCRSRRHLDVHHVVFRSRGGSDEDANLLTLCSRCHRLLHEGCVQVEGSAEGGLRVRIGRDRPDCAPTWLVDGIRAGPPP